MSVFDKVSVLIPWRSDGIDGPRQRAWSYLERCWARLGVEVCVGVDDGDAPFNCAAAQNRAFRASTRPYLLMFGADCLPDGEAIQMGLEVMATTGEPWVPLFDRTEYFDQQTTDWVIRDLADPFRCAPDLAYSVPFQTGVIALHRWAYLSVGGMDERFVGWGAEDSAFRHALAERHGDSTPLPFALHCLWHPAPERGAMSAENLRLVQSYEQVRGPAEMSRFLAARGSYVD